MEILLSITTVTCAIMSLVIAHTTRVRMNEVEHFLREFLRFGPFTITVTRYDDDLTFEGDDDDDGPTFC